MTAVITYLMKKMIRMIPSSSRRDCYYPAGVMVFYERDGDTDYWRVKHKWARTREEALVMMKEHLEYFIRYIKDIRSAEIRRCADAYER